MTVYKSLFFFFILILLSSFTFAASWTDSTTQWGGTVTDKGSSNLVYYKFDTDCSNNFSTSYDCSLKTGASILDSQLYINRTADTGARAELFESGIILDKDSFCNGFIKK